MNNQLKQIKMTSYKTMMHLVKKYDMVMNGIKDGFRLITYNGRYTEAGKAFPPSCGMLRKPTR